jgi:hypothetical protein
VAASGGSELWPRWWSPPASWRMTSSSKIS